MHLTYSVGSLLPYNNFSTINVYVILPNIVHTTIFDPELQFIGGFPPGT